VNHQDPLDRLEAQWYGLYVLCLGASGSSIGNRT